MDIARAWRRLGGTMLTPSYLDEALEQPLRRNDQIELTSGSLLARALQQYQHGYHIGEFWAGINDDEPYGSGQTLRVAPEGRKIAL